jgi:transglutaminase-like putative cysteine protease
VAIFAILVFFMGRELIGALYAWGFLGLLAVAFFIDHSALPHPSRILINLTTVAALVAIFVRVRFNFLIEALMESILLMVAVKMLEDKHPRDYVQIVLLGVASLLCYSMLSAEKDFIVYCFGMGLTSTLILLLSTWLDKDPRAFVSVRELRQLFTRTGVIFLAMLPLCLLLFFGLPRINSPIFGTRGRYGIAATGFSEQVQLGDVSHIQSNNKLAFRAKMAPLNYNDPYWRGMVLDIFEGRVWVSSRNTLGRGNFIPEADAPRIEQEIVLEAGNRGVLFALDQPFAILGVDTILDGDGAFRYRSRNVGRRLRYKAMSVVSSQMRPAFTVDTRRYLTLPVGFIPRLRSLVENMIQGMNNREKVSAVMGFLSSSEFLYSLEGLPNTGNALEQFIFVNKRGNCEYFAAAMGVMLRMAGVPARLVAGYRGGVYNEAGGYYMVQEQNAHVWVEAWDSEKKVWVRHEPTPAGTVLSSALSSYDTFSMYLDLLDYQWSKLINYNWDTQIDLARNLRDVLHNPRASLPPTQDGFRRLGAALSFPATVLAVLAACVALFILVHTLKKRRPEIVLLNDFLRAMRRNGYRRHESEGLSEFLERVDDANLRILALPFVRNFEGCYYRDRPMDSELHQKLRQRIKKIYRSRKVLY